MEGIIAFIAVVVAFFITLVFTKYWIRVARRSGILGKDMNKHDHPDVAEAGGVAVILGFSIAILIYVSFETFYLHSDSSIVFIFATLTSILLAGFLGFAEEPSSSRCYSGYRRKPADSFYRMDGTFAPGC